VVATSLNSDLPDFRRSATDGASRVIASAVTNPRATHAADGYGHGTHVAGLIAGNGTARTAADGAVGRYVGIAPEADLVSIKASDDHGATSVLDVIYGLQFAVDHREAYGIRVVNLSLSSSVAESPRTDPLDAAAESAWLHGIVVVAAAGNAGAAADAVAYAPANDPYVITVGAVDDAGTASTSDDQVPSWSSRGLTQDGVPKPDVLAPGAHLVSTLAPDSDFAGQCPDCLVDGSYFRVGGTSMAAAVVSGAVADLLDAHPTWTPNQVKGALTHTGPTVAGSPGRMLRLPAALSATGRTLTANAGLQPSPLLDPATGDLDPGRIAWTGASWRAADGSSLDAGWAGASWRCDCSLLGDGSVDPAAAAWRGASWRRTTDFAK
jgi:serine protease AprX